VIEHKKEMIYQINLRNLKGWIDQIEITIDQIGILIKNKGTSQSMTLRMMDRTKSNIISKAKVTRHKVTKDSKETSRGNREI